MLLLVLACSAPLDAPVGASLGGATVKAATLTALDYCPGLHLVLDLTLPSMSRDPSPVVVLVHGGGWTQGSREDDSLTFIRADLVHAGFAVASIDYRLADGTVLWEDQVADIECALDYLRADTVHGLDGGRIALLAASAGGHLAAMASESAQALVLWYSPTDLTEAFNGLPPRTQFMIFGQRRPTEAQKEDASPIYAITPPIVFLAHGTEDPVVPYAQSVAAARLWGAELLTVDSTRHGFGAARDEVGDATVEWLLSAM